MTTYPKHGEIWWAHLDPTTGHEQAGHRPVLVISADDFNRIPNGLVVVCPLTTSDRGYPSHIAIHATPPPRKPSWAMTEMVRSISTERLGNRMAVADASTLQAVSLALKRLLKLE